VARVLRLVPLVLAAALLVAGQRGASTWRVSIDSAAPGEPLDRALLGHYDLSGALFAYDEVPGLVSAATEAGIAGADWRVGLGRWEAGTQLLPSLTNGTPCPIPTPAAAAPALASDLDLIAARDWFTDDAGYALGYARSVLDVAAAFGAEPYLSVDAMPRALAVNRTPTRADCLWSFTNRVSNVRPADPAAFAAALTGALERLRLGSDGEPGRAFTHVELWNEPELPFFWDPAFEAGALDRFFEMAVTTLVELDAWRAASPHPEIQALRFGLGSFALASTAAQVVTTFDATPLPGGARIPLDFVSFHAYADDPLAVVGAIETVRAAVAGSTHYAELELALAEWGPDLDARASDPDYAASIEPALHAATVIAEGAARGLDRAHRAILWDFYPDELVTLGIVDHAGHPKPLQRAYALLARMIDEGGERLSPSELLVPADGSVLVSRDAAGRVRALFVNRSDAKRKARVALDGKRVRPTSVLVFSDPEGGIVNAKPKKKLELPPRSLVLAEF